MIIHGLCTTVRENKTDIWCLMKCNLQTSGTRESHKIQIWLNSTGSYIFGLIYWIRGFGNEDLAVDRTTSHECDV